ncbi:hypothetical protein B0H16DRAFT_1885309 [Mycena metata]|uniref:DUF6534 domain-containing protein n=1 Tax=Mycena metata TaxID=1033252 RepID=A0AAD7NFA0_9AGAR|nr:hypothetical protein B0H16DRAFT_1885309 [Mycena metata]
MDSAISLTIGAYQIGVLLSCFLFGVMTTQTYVYYGRFPDDPLRLKILVAFVCLFEVGQAICIGHTLYVLTVVDYGHPERLAGNTPRSFPLAALFAGLSTICVQGFFSLRIYLLSERRLVPILVALMLLFRLVDSGIIGATAFSETSVGSYEARWGWLFTTAWSVSAACDLIITGTLVAILIRQRTYGLRRTGALMDKLIAWTIETGMLTSASWILILVCYVTMRHNFVWVSVFVVNARLFSNSLLASLNSRTTLRAMNEVSLPSLHLTAALEVPSDDYVQPLKGIAGVQVDELHRDGRVVS